MQTIETFAYIYWELCLLLASVRLAYICGWKEEAHRSELMLAWLSISIVLSSWIASFYSFALLNSSVSYLAAATLVLVLLYARNPSRLKSDICSLLSLFDRPVIEKGFFPLAISAALCVPVLLMSMRPVDETDSFYYLNFMLNWLNNRTIPYEFYRNYPAFWQVTYMPGLAITRSDAFFWLTSLKPVIIVCLGIYCIGREFGFSRRLALLVAINGIALQYFWIGPSGVSTLKEDMVHAAGIVLIAHAVLRTVRRGVNMKSGLLLSVGFVFITTKWNGFFISALGLPLMAFFTSALISKARKAFFVWILCSFAFFLTTTGHYYLRNILAHNNPFYPYQVSFMDIHLPGTIEAPGTSILESLSNRGVWQAFFSPASGISPAGLLFPLILGCILISSIYISIRSPIALFRHKPLIKKESFLAMYILLTWLLYFRAFWSASDNPGDLVYLFNLNSLRFVEGTLALSELFLVYLLWRLKTKELLLLGLAGLSLASRLAILYLRWPSAIGRQTLMLIVILSLLVLVGLSLIRTNKFHRILCWSILGFFAVFIGPLVVETNRSNSWAPWWRGVLLPLQNIPPARVYVVIDPGDFDRDLIYPVSGRRLQHTVQIATQEKLLNSLRDKNLLETERARPDYVVKIRDPNRPDKAKLAAFGSRLFSYGWGTVAINRCSILLQQMEMVAFSDIVKGKPPRAWFMKSPRPLLPGTSVEHGNAKPGMAILRKGDLALFGNPSQLYLLGDRKPKVVIADEGEKLLALNLGMLDENGMAQGIEFTYQQGRWAPDMPDPRPINQDYDFSIARATNSVGPWRISTSRGGTYKVEHLFDETGPFMRVKSTSGARWLVIIGRFPENLADNTPVTVRGQIRSTIQTRTTLHLYDLNDRGRYEKVARSGTSLGSWEQLSLSKHMRFPSPKDYYAIGLLRPKKGEYFDVREFSLFKGVFPD
jgi:hypothetical protein